MGTWGGTINRTASINPTKMTVLTCFSQKNLLSNAARICVRHLELFESALKRFTDGCSFQKQI